MLIFISSKIVLLIKMLLIDRKKTTLFHFCASLLGELKNAIVKLFHILVLTYPVITSMRNYEAFVRN